LAPGDYQVLWNGTPWMTTALSITKDDVAEGTPKQITLEIPAPSIIDLGDDNGRYGSLSAVLETRQGPIDENGQRRPGSFLYCSLNGVDAEGRILAWLSPTFNVLTVSDREREKGGVLFVKEQETAGKTYSLVVKPMAAGRIRFIDKATGEPIVGVSVEMEFSCDYLNRRQRVGARSIEATTDSEGVAEFKGMFSDVEYHIANPTQFEESVERSFIATKPGELTDFGEVRCEPANACR
jgi:hypothetical protein